LTQNADLKAYNTQIAQRMQERDEDLAAAYEANKRKDKAIIELVIVCVIALLAAAALIYTHIIRT
jgi:flagellar basal body-associated protein FliL